VRLVIPEMYGYKNVKWLTGINLVPRLEQGYWEELGYDQNAWVGRSNGYGT
jgi:DMSO/TMAO reductase YedYZ molybdopterin-dependent catalytic subunit